MAARDQNGDGVRDVTIDDIAQNLNRPVTNWEIQNIVQVASASYPTFDQMVMSTAMTDTRSVLGNFNFAAPTEIRVAGRVNVVQYSTLAPAPTATNVQPSDIVLYVAGQNGNNGAINASPKAAVFGQGSTLQLNVVASNGTIQVDQLANVTGALIGRWVSVGQQVKLTLVSAFAQTNTGNAASVVPSTDEAAEPPAVETPVGEEQGESNEDEYFPPVDPPVEEEPIPGTWTHALFLPLVTTSGDGNASSAIIEPEVFEELTPVSDSTRRTATPVEAIQPDRTTTNQIFVPVVTR